MRAAVADLSGTKDTGRVLAEAWVVLEMHFLSRPHLIAEARHRLAETLVELQAQGVFDPHSLKDRACRHIQMQYGPAPPLDDEHHAATAQRWMA